jgi:Raf kinase inhibitor-like YbhB/YbcL family protein
VRAQWQGLLLFTSLAAVFAIYGGAAMATETKIERLNVQSPDFASGALIPTKFSGDGKDISPSLNWTKPPAQTKSFAVTCTDPDAPRGTWWHWIIFNLAPETLQLKEGQGKGSSLAGGVSQGTNDFGNTGYNGPAPPKGPIHHYHFTVYALDTTLALKPACSKAELTAALNGHVLASGEYIGTFVRR